MGTKCRAVAGFAPIMGMAWGANLKCEPGGENRCEPRLQVRSGVRRLGEMDGQSGDAIDPFAIRPPLRQYVVTEPLLDHAGYGAAHGVGLPAGGFHELA